MEDFPCIFITLISMYTQLKFDNGRKNMQNISIFIHATTFV